MKKIVLLLAVLLFGAGSMMAQQGQVSRESCEAGRERSKKAEKAAKKGGGSRG